MNVEASLLERSGSKCELCSSAEHLSVYEVPPQASGGAESCVMVCETCRGQLSNPETADPNHWRCLNDSMWSPVPAVQVMAWRMLTKLKSEGWPQDLLETLYLEEDVLRWAESGISSDEEAADGDGIVATVDSNGTVLNVGDSVTLIKDLTVKGAGFTAKRGTLVKNIALTLNPKHIEGRVNGTLIVLVAAFLKKAN